MLENEYFYISTLNTSTLIIYIAYLYIEYLYIKHLHALLLYMDMRSITWLLVKACWIWFQSFKNFHLESMDLKVYVKLCKMQVFSFYWDHCLHNILLFEEILIYSGFLANLWL